ncbi:MAG: zf-HC2 domain-containing protein [Phycisphaerae bacterium]
MNCKQVRRWLSPYLDSELGPTKTFEISEHLAACDACRWRFERERRVDRAVAERLGEVPAVKWGEVESAAMRPSGVLRPWAARGGAVLGLAACLMFGLWLAVPGPRGPSAPARAAAWLGDRFAEAAPLGRPFEATPVSTSDLASIMRDTLGASVAFQVSDDDAPHHVFELAQVHRRRFPDGGAYIEIRANCCGQPVLIVAAREGDAARLAALADRLAGDHDAERDTPGALRLGGLRDAGVVVTVVSRHTVRQVVSAMRVSKV